MFCKLIKKLTNRVCFWTILRLLEGFPSGQRDQTVNLTRKLRWFESTSRHQIDKAIKRVGRQNLYAWRAMLFKSGICGHSLMVEPQPSKLMMRVRFPLPAPRSGDEFLLI